MNGYLLIEYGRDGNSYDVYFHREDAEKALVKKVKEYATIVGDPVGFSDSFDASDGIYEHRGEVIFEIAQCNVIGEIFYPQEG